MTTATAARITVWGCVGWLVLAAPARPTLVATYEPPGAPMDLSVSGALVYLALASRDPSAPGVIILRLSD